MIRRELETELGALRDALEQALYRTQELREIVRDALGIEDEIKGEEDT